MHIIPLPWVLLAFLWVPGAPHNQIELPIPHSPSFNAKWECDHFVQRQPFNSLIRYECVYKPHM